jgi:hypothetical protein
MAQKARTQATSKDREEKSECLMRMKTFEKSMTMRREKSAKNPMGSRAIEIIGFGNKDRKDNT